MGNPVVHWELAAKDPQKTSEFYAELFDWKINHHPEMQYWMAHTGGEGGIDGGIMAPHGDAPNFVTFYVLVDDLAAYLAKAESLGGKTIMGPMPIPGVGSCAMFQDPGGNCIGLYKGLE